METIEKQGKEKNFEEIKTLIWNDCDAIQKLIEQGKNKEGEMGQSQEKNLWEILGHGENEFQVTLDGEECKCVIFGTRIGFTGQILKQGLGTWVIVDIQKKCIHIVQHANKVKEYELNGKVNNNIDHLFYNLLEQIHKYLNFKFLNKDKAGEIIQSSADEIAKVTK